MRCILIFFFGFAIITKISAQELKQQEFNFSVGYMFEGEGYAWEFDRYYSVGETVLIQADYTYYFKSMSGRFGLGAYYTYGSPYYGSYEVVTQHEFGLLLKTRFNLNDQLLIKPGAFFGYRTYADEAGDGLGINGSVALQYISGKKVNPFFEVGILSQPAGGNDATDITYSPVLKISIGITL